MFQTIEDIGILIAKAQQAFRKQNAAQADGASDAEFEEASDAVGELTAHIIKLVDDFNKIEMPF